MTTMKKNIINIDYAGNLRKQLGIKDSEAGVLDKAFGLLKGNLKKTSASYTHSLRKEWDRRVGVSKA